MVQQKKEFKDSRSVKILDKYLRTYFFINGTPPLGPNQLSIIHTSDSIHHTHSLDFPFPPGRSNGSESVIPISQDAKLALSNKGRTAACPRRGEDCVQRDMDDEGDAKADEEVDAEDIVPAPVGGDATDLVCEAGEKRPYSHYP